MNDVRAASQVLGSAGVSLAVPRASRDTSLENAFPISNGNSLRFEAGRLKERAGRPRSPTTARATYE